MKDFAIIIKKNNNNEHYKKDNNFFIKSILYYGLNISENNILFLDFTNTIDNFYDNIVFIKEYANSLENISKKTLYIYIDNSEVDLLENTYCSYYFYSILELFMSKMIFIQYAGIILFDEPIFKYYLSYNIKRITAELSDKYEEFNSSIIVFDNFKMNDMVLNIIDFTEINLDFFSFILNNVKTSIYSNILITKNCYLFKNYINDDICIFINHSNYLIKNYLYSIYELHNNSIEEFK